MNQLEAYMELILAGLKKEQRKTEYRMSVKPERPIDFVLEGRLGAINSIIATVERDLNYLREEFKIEDSP